MKAVSRFKTLIARKRPDLVQSILGHASKFVRPPKSMHPPSSRAKGATTISISDEEMQQARKKLADKGDHQGAHLVDELDRLPGHIRTAVVSTTQPDETKDAKSPDHADSPPPAESPRSLRKVHTDPQRHPPEPGKGHAHDPLKEQRFLSIGPGPHPNDLDGAADSASPSFASDPSDIVVSESPPPVGDDDIFERAYDKEVANIYSEKGRSTTVYLTRRVEKKMRPKIEHASAEASSLKSSWQGAARSRLAGAVGDEKAEQAAKAGSAAGQSAKSGLSNIVGKAVNAAKDDHNGEHADESNRS